MPNSQPPVSGAKRILQRDIFAGSPAPNALIAGSQPGQSYPGAPMQPQQPQQDNPLTAAIAQHLQSLAPAALAREAARSDYMVHSYGTLARKPDLTFKDVISQAGQAVADGKATPEEATQEVSGLPQNPVALKAALQQRFQAMIISAAMLSGVKGGPAGPATPPGAPPMGTPT